MAITRRIIDWDIIEREYRVGTLSVSEIARQHGITHVAIIWQAKKNGWERNLARKVKQKVSERAAVDGIDAKSAKEAIEFAAERSVQIIRSHRKQIGQARDLVGLMFEELRDGVAELDDGARKVALSTRANTMLALSNSLKILIGLEREAFNIQNDNIDDKDPLEGLTGDGLRSLSRAIAIARSGRLAGKDSASAEGKLN